METYACERKSCQEFHNRVSKIDTGRRAFYFIFHARAIGKAALFSVALFKLCLSIKNGVDALHSSSARRSMIFLAFIGIT